MSKSRSAVERAQEADGKKKTKSYGRYFVAEPRVMDGGPMPTRDEWLEEQEQKKGVVAERRPRGDGGHILQGKK